MERCREKDAAEKLADWYGLNGNKAAPPIERRPEVPHIETHQKDSPDHNSSGDSVKYMQEVDAWFDGLMKRGAKSLEFPSKATPNTSLKTTLPKTCLNSFAYGATGLVDAKFCSGAVSTTPSFGSSSVRSTTTGSSGIMTG